MDNKTVEKLSNICQPCKDLDETLIRQINSFTETLLMTTNIAFKEEESCSVEDLNTFRNDPERLIGYQGAL